MESIPEFELSYEIISHKTVPDTYNLCLAIPYGKKKLIWITFNTSQNVIYTFDINKDKKLSNCVEQEYNFGQHDTKSLALGTLLYATAVINDDTTFYVIEDIFYFKGISTKKMKLIEKMVLLERVLASLSGVYKLPYMWINNNNVDIPDIPYKTAYIQYRTTHDIKPFINYTKKTDFDTKPTDPIMKPTATKPVPQFRIDTNKPQYQYNTIFRVTADLQYDIYKLHAYGKNNSIVFYNLAYIPNYKSSIYMNGIFRNIRENKNLDYIEESDDEDDFQNTSLDKYVDLQKVVLMECVFHTKFKKWIPIKVVHNNSKVVHINSLVNFAFR